MKEKLEQMKNEALEAITKANDSSSLNDIRVRYLGKSGEMTLLMRGLGSVSKEERPVLGKMFNDVRAEIESSLEAKTSIIVEQEKQARLLAEDIDVTLPSSFKGFGTLHPLSKTKKEIVDTFLQMGFTVDEGPEIETDLFNFQLLNVPKDHPAREMQDTFYVGEEKVLRTQTSSMQARIMTTQQPPIRVIIPGKVYRSDDDVSHSPIFHQIEGLAVDKHITMGDLQGCLEAFAEKVFSPETKVRLRPSYFPFTEPSVEVDITCANCGGKGCNMCKGTGYIEILGGGMVHPNVLKMNGYDPEVYSGFAFGIGIERVAMLRYGIDDIRKFYQNDVRFLHQFKKKG